MEILEDDDQGALGGHRLEQAADAPEDLLDRQWESPSPIAPATRDATSSSPPARATSFERAGSGESWSLIAAAWVTISISGQKVMPRP